MKFGNLVEIGLWPHLAVKGVGMNVAHVKHVVLCKKTCHITTLPPSNGHLSTTATFFCPQGDRCGEVRL